MSILRRNTFHKISSPFLRNYYTSKEENAVCLIEIRRGQLVLNEEALKSINELKDSIIIVSIFGKERTGKSYLMNLLLNPDQNTKLTKGFKVSSQISNSNSKGIYLWNSPICKPNSKEKILFLDSEGINSENVFSQEMDSKLLSLILLISSIFIYNSIGDITSNSLNELELIVHLADSIGTNEKINKDKLISELCPKFIWALRDFDLKQLENISNKNDYMEQCLKERFGGENKDEINVIKENLIKYFKERECVTLPMPLEEEKDLFILKKKGINLLTENFRNEFMILKNIIYNSSKAKEIKRKIINGPMIAYFIKTFVDAINKGNIPNISEIFNELINQNIETNYNKAQNFFKKKLEKIKNEEYDLDIKELYSLKYEAIQEYMNILEKFPEITKKDNYINAYNIKKEQFENEMEKEINDILNDLITNNSYGELFNDKNQNQENKEYKKSSELIEDYLNKLSDLKISSDTTILNNNDFDNFIQNDINETKKIIDFMKKNNELISNNQDIDINKREEENLKNEKNIEEHKENSENKENEENKEKNGENKEILKNTNNYVDNKEYENLKTELENTEKYALELIGKFTKLLDKRDKIAIKNNFKQSRTHPRHSIKSYSTKLVNIYNNEDKLCEISSEEKPAEKCNCSMDSFKNCFIY